MRAPCSCTMDKVIGSLRVKTSSSKIGPSLTRRSSSRRDFPTHRTSSRASQLRPKRSSLIVSTGAKKIHLAFMSHRDASMTTASVQATFWQLFRQLKTASASKARRNQFVFQARSWSTVIRIAAATAARSTKCSPGASARVSSPRRASQLPVQRTNAQMST